MSKERRLLPHHKIEVLGALAFAAALGACNRSGIPASSSASPDNTSSPVPAETAKPTPTTTPTLEPTATPTQTFNMPPVPTPEMHSGTWKAGDVIESGPPGVTVDITFDDCYSPLDTEKAIKTAYELGARITLFCIGAAINNPEQAENMKLAVAYGDELENHTRDHAPMTTSDVAFMKKEMSDQLAIVRKDLGDPNYKEYLIRPPFGRGAYSPYLLKAANEEGLKIVTWTVDSEGWIDAYNTSPERVQKIVNQVNSELLDDYGNLKGGTIF